MVDKMLKHIEHYVKSKGIKIVKYCGGSRFNHDTPDTIFIDVNSGHGISASILHEYYHCRQYKRGKILTGWAKSDKFKANAEYRAETFAIRCFKKLGITYDDSFINRCWRDRPAEYLETSGYYVTAYALLKKNRIL